MPIVEPEVTLGPGDYGIEETAFWSERMYRWGWGAGREGASEAGACQGGRRAGLADTGRLAVQVTRAMAMLASGGSQHLHRKASQPAHPPRAAPIPSQPRVPAAERVRRVPRGDPAQAQHVPARWGVAVGGWGVGGSS